MDERNKTQEYFLITHEDFEVDDLQKLLRRVNKCEKRYKALIEADPHGIQVIDIYGKIAYINTIQCKLLGYKVRELEGRDIWGLLETEADRRELTDYLTKLAQNEHLSRLWIGNYIRKDRKIRELKLEWNGMRDEHGRVIGFISFTTGIIKY
ncbi:PAS domain-containing protein [Desulfococcaceae bacterium HSG8]|nr:PAS domain-containing protein [Desulfococcaceae bacterium HSG8]